MHLLGFQKQEPAMAPLPKWKPRRTLIDLYMERDQIHWYWRLTGTMSAAAIMIGFLIFPASFPNNPSEWSNSTSSAIVAGVFLAIGYLSAAALTLFRRSWLFQMDVVFVPCLLSSLFGLINTVIAISTHHGKQSILNSSSLAALILSIVSTSTYLVLSLITFHKIHRVRERDFMHRHRSDSDTYHLLPEDEMQRQQLLRLLQRENNSKIQKPNSADASQSTFRIALPDSLRRMETRLTAPQSVHEDRRTESNYNSRSLNFSPLSPFSSSRRTPSPYEPLREQEQEQESEADRPPQLPQIPPSSPLPERTFTQSSRATAAAAPPYSPGGRSVEAPIEKRGEIADLTGEVHPLEREERLEQERERQRERERARPQYRVVDAPADPSRLLSPSPTKNRDRRGGEVRRQRSTSRESRRAEIELERAGGANGEGRETGMSELEGVKVSPRIMRVETDGWGRR